MPFPTPPPNEAPGPNGMAWSKRSIIGSGPFSIMGQGPMAAPGTDPQTTALDEGEPAPETDPAAEGAEAPGIDPASIPMTPPPISLQQSTDELLKDDPLVIDPDSLLLKPDEEILGVAYARMMRSCAFRAPFETRWKNNWTDWMMYLRGESKAWQSRVFIPLCYEQVSSAVPSFVAAIYDSGKLWDISSKTGESETQAGIVQDAAEYYMRVRTNSEREAEDWVKYSLIFGTGVLRASWLRVRGVKREQEEVKVPMPDGTEMTAGTRMKNTHDAIIENRPVLEAVDLWNWFPAPYVAAGGAIPWCFERVETTVEDLVRDATSGLFGDDGPQRVKEWLDTRPETQGQVGALWAQANSRASSWGSTDINSPYTTDFQTSEGGDRKHAQIVYWVMWANDYRITISGEGGKVLGKVPNPYQHGEIPYTDYCFDRIPKCPFGRGIAEVVADIQKQINFNYNKGNDAAQLAINKPIKLRGAGNAGVSLVWQPGVVVRLRDVTDMEPMDVKNPMGEVLQMEQHLIAHANNATGINDLARGTSEPGINTATESSNVQGQFRMRMSGHARNLRGAMSRVGRHVVSMIQQFIDTPTAISVSGPKGLEWKTVSPEELVGEFDVVSTANFSKSNPSSVRADLIAVAPIALADPAVNHVEFLTRLFEGFGFDHVERLVVQPPPPMRDPMLEEMALDMGMEVEPSPDEVTTGGLTQHLQVHLAKQQARLAPGSGANPDAIRAGMKHIQKTMEMAQQVQAQGQPPPGAGAPPPGGPPKKPGGGPPARRDATRLGQQSGSDGPPGQSPGPVGVPRRPSPQNPAPKPQPVS